MQDDTDNRFINLRAFIGNKLNEVRRARERNKEAMRWIEVMQLEEQERVLYYITVYMDKLDKKKVPKIDWIEGSAQTENINKKPSLFNVLKWKW